MIINPIIPIWLMSIICIAIILINIKSKNKFSILRQIIIAVLLFLINIRIMIPGGNASKISNNLDVLLVIDNTISMIAEDYNENTPRLTAVKEDCNYIIDKLTGAKFSVITFNNESQIKIPFTKDVNAVSNVIDTIQVIDTLYSKGSSLNIAFNDMKTSLELSTKNKDRKRVVFFISDGEITNEDTLKSFSELKEYIYDGAVLGYGTKKGGYMKETNSYSTSSTYLKDTTTYPYTKAVSKIDEANLKKLAQDMGIEYINMENQSNIDKKLENVIKSSLESDNGIEISSYKDIYYIFVIPLCLLLFYEFILCKRRNF